MRKRVIQSMCLAIGIGLLGTTQALADPLTVTSGLVTAQIRGGTFTLTGDGFSLSGAPPGGYESGLWECTPCRASVFSSNGRGTSPSILIRGPAASSSIER